VRHIRSSYKHWQRLYTLYILLKRCMYFYTAASDSTTLWLHRLHGHISKYLINRNLHTIRSIRREQISHKAGLRQRYMLSIRNLKTREGFRNSIRAAILHRGACRIISKHRLHLSLIRAPISFIVNADEGPVICLVFCPVTTRPRGGQKGSCNRPQRSPRSHNA
jgi:hypothetical protein